jgi:putative oxidoreductase
MRYIVALGRALFAAIFVLSGPNHFRPETWAYAAGYGVPKTLVELAGLVALAGGLSVLLGYRARAGAWLLVLFLVPVTLTMHNFWSVADAQEAMMQRINFMKNLSMLGAALIVAYFGSGPFSLDSALGSRRALKTRGPARYPREPVPPL